MAFRFLILIPILLTGCNLSHRADTSTVTTPVVEHSSRTLDSFRFIGADTTLNDVTARLGEPDRDIGSGIYIYEYRLSDRSYVLIGSADRLHILYVRHGQDVLFMRQ